MATATGTAAATGRAMTGIVIILPVITTTATTITTIIAAGTKQSGRAWSNREVKEKPPEKGGFLLGFPNSASTGQSLRAAQSRSNG
jgi:hypothetical protein